MNGPIIPACWNLLAKDDQMRRVQQLFTSRDDALESLTNLMLTGRIKSGTVRQVRCPAPGTPLRSSTDLERIGRK